MTDHPITPPPHLMNQWESEAVEECRSKQNYSGFERETLKLIKAARWGADQELEACVNYVDNTISGNKAREFRAIRRPKPPSLKAQALAELVDAYDEDKIDDTAYDTICRALEQLDD